MIIGITGGKGGTGKTVLAVNLAVAIAREGKSVAYLDCDADCPSSHIIGGFKLEKTQPVKSFIPVIDSKKCKKCGKCVESCKFNALYQLKGKCPVLLESMCIGCTACLNTCPHKALSESYKIIGWTYFTKKYGVDFYSGKLKPSEPLTEKIVEAVKQRGLKKYYDIVLVDTAAGAHCQVVSALIGCEKALAVTEPTLFGEHDLKVISELLQKLGIPFEVVLNRSTITDKKIKSVLEIPYDKNMVECYVDSTPIVEQFPNHTISKKITNFARRLIR